MCSSRTGGEGEQPELVNQGEGEMPAVGQLLGVGGKRGAPEVRHAGRLEVFTGYRAYSLERTQRRVGSDPARGGRGLRLRSRGQERER